MVIREAVAREAAVVVATAEVRVAAQAAGEVGWTAATMASAAKQAKAVLETAGNMAVAGTVDPVGAREALAITWWSTASRCDHWRHWCQRIRCQP